jgi:hypothetical protein
MFYKEARLKKNILPSDSMRGAAGFSLLGFWKENNSALLIGILVVFVIVIFVWLILRRRHEVFPEIKYEAENPTPEKDTTIIESEPDKVVRATSYPGIYGKIEVLVNNQQINTYLVTDNPLTIGRDPAQALAIIQAAIVSKLHCSIFFRDGQIFIKDLDSTNGIYVNDEKVSERELHDNDIVSLGKKGTVKIIYHK